MLRLQLYLFICFSCIAFFAQAQKHVFLKPDSVALHTPQYLSSNIDSLAIYLSSPFNTEIEKSRSIFRWITNNIAYDVNKQITVFKNENDFSQDALRVLKNKRAVCEGYANLFFELCKRSGLIAQVVTGYAITDGFTIPQPHAWNAVRLNNEWKLLDATWAAGGVDGGKNTFKKKFDETFFLLSADSFLLTHYPIDPMWQLQINPVSFSLFKQKKISGTGNNFMFNDTIAAHFALNAIDSMKSAYNQNMRALQYNPDDFYAKTMLNDIEEFYRTQQFDKATDLASLASLQFNDVVTIVNDAKKKRNTKKLNDKETYLVSNINEAQQKMKSTLEMYSKIGFTSGINKITLEENIVRVKKNLNMMTEIEKYLNRYFKTPVEKRNAVL